MTLAPLEVEQPDIIEVPSEEEEDLSVAHIICAGDWRRGKRKAYCGADVSCAKQVPPDYEGGLCTFCALELDCSEGGWCHFCIRVAKEPR